MASLTDNLSGSQRDAYAAVRQMLKTYGLDSLAPKILQFIQDGYSTDTVSLMLQDTPEWKQRFAANETRRKNGLSVLSPAEYIATERAYRQVMQAAGLPSGFYDQNSDFTKFLSNDTSPAELQQRVQAASDFVDRQDPQQLAYFRQYYTKGDMIAYALDPNRAAPAIEKAFQAATIGGEAAKQGLHVGQQTAESLAAQGITQQQADQGFGQIANDQPNLNKLASIYGEQQFTTQDLVQSTFNNDQAVQKRERKLASQERATFGGSSGASSGSLTNTSQSTG